MRLGGQLSRWVFGISPEETQFERRGFHEYSASARKQLETSGAAFVDGYNLALASGDSLRSLRAGLEEFDASYRGFAYEGAAMALGILDTLIPWNRHRWNDFLNGEAAHHSYMMHVGLGWSMARLRRPVIKSLGRFTPMMRYLVVDGYAFHQAFFAPSKFLQGQHCALHGYSKRAFDQGLGRSLWFVSGADPTRIHAAIELFDAARKPDLWSGVGLACAYAGGVDQNDIQRLKELSGDRSSFMAQGAAFAAKARVLAGNLEEHTSMACMVLCKCSAEAAARATDELWNGDIDAHEAPLRESPNTKTPEPAYEQWRRALQAHFAQQGVAV